MPRNSSPIFDFFFLKPVPAVIWIMLLLFTGLVGYHSMNKESLPDLEIPEAHIITEWDGATPAMVEKDVTRKLELRLNGMKGLKSIYSTSMRGVSIIAVRFRAECSLSESMQLLGRKVTAAQGELPKDAERSRIEESSVRDLPIATFALSGNVPRSELERRADELKRIFERVPGIKRVVKVGTRREIVRITLHPERLTAMSIPGTLVRETVTGHGYDAPWGEFEKEHQDFFLNMEGAYRDLDSIRNLVLMRRDEGTVVRLGDVAEVTRSHLRERTRASLSTNGSPFEPVAALELLKASGRDTTDLVAAVAHVADTATASPLWPKSVHCRMIGNQAEVIDTELNRGFNNGLQAMLAVFLVLFFLLSWREAAVAALSVPLTLFGSMAVLWALGYTFNLLVIVGMILALGLLVDDFILIMEGMHENVFIKGLDFRESVKRTIATYALPSFAGSVTTILVFLPLAFVGGTDGKFIRVIPVTAAVCLVVSYVVSVVLGPSLFRAALGKRAHMPGRQKLSWMDRLSMNTERRLSAWLSRSVVASRNKAAWWTAGAMGVFLLSLVFAFNLRDTLYPKEDGRGLGITVELAPDATLEETVRVGDKLGTLLADKPYFLHVMRVAGGMSSMGMSSFHDMMGRNTARNMLGFNCFLVPGRERDKLAYEYAEPIRAEFEKALENEPAARIYMAPQIGGSSGEDAVQIDITGDDPARLREIAEQVRFRLARVPGVVDVRDNIGPVRTELRFRPMDEPMAHYKVTRRELAGQMIALMEHEKVGKFRRAGVEEDLDIRLGTDMRPLGGTSSREEPADHSGPKTWQQLERVTIINSEGEPIPLWSLAEPSMVAAEHVRLHKEGRRSVTVMAKLDGAYMSEVINHMRPKLKEMQQEWPAGYEFVFAGEEDVNTTYTNMLKVFLVSIVLVYAVLALLFDSLLHPGIILSTVLFALIGVFTGFFLMGDPFSFSAAIGIVALVGIVVNDAVIIVETMNNHLKNGIPPAEAAARGAADRLRPIVGTTVTNFAGLTPLALSDPGWAPLCRAIIFGEIAATIGAVVLVPALYALLTPAGAHRPKKTPEPAR